MAKNKTSKVSKATRSKTNTAKTTKAKATPVKPKAKSTKPTAKLVAKSVAKTVTKKTVGKISAKEPTKTGGLKRFNPLDDRILIERVTLNEKTAGGLYIPDSAQQKPTKGRVVAVGRGHCDAKGRVQPCDVKVGDTVLFTAWAGAEIELDGTTYVIMREPDLLGVTNV